MALSMLRQETTQWETVKSRRADRRKKETLEKGAQSAAQVVPGLPDNEKNAFAAFDALHSETVRGDDARSWTDRLRSLCCVWPFVVEVGFAC